MKASDMDKAKELLTELEAVNRFAQIVEVALDHNGLGVQDVGVYLLSDGGQDYQGESVPVNSAAGRALLSTLQREAVESRAAIERQLRELGVEP